MNPPEGDTQNLLWLNTLYIKDWKVYIAIDHAAAANH